MKIVKVPALIAIPLIVGLVIGNAYRPFRPVATSTAPTGIDDKRDVISIPELVASQLTSGELSCPDSDNLAYEACLLYQGALGTWQRLGVPDVCPDVIGDSFSPPRRLSPAAPRRLSPAAGIQLTPEDARRAPSTPCFGYLYAIQVVNATPILISTASTTFHMSSGKSYSNPGSNAKLCIEVRHGICGNHAAVGTALFKLATLKARPVEFYYASNGQRLNHIVTEVLIDDHWRLVDTTYGAYWASNVPGKPFALATLDDLLKQGPDSKKIRQFYNPALLPYGIYSAISRPDFFGYLTPGASVLRGNNGSIRLMLHDDIGVERFAHLPNYLGDNHVDGTNSGGVSYELDAPAGSYALSVKVTGSAFGGVHPVSLCVDDNCVPFVKSRKEYLFSATNPRRVHVKSDNDVAYVVLNSLHWQRQK